MIRDFAGTHQVFGAGDLVREHRRDQVFGAHPLERRRHLLAAAKTRQRERDAGNPAPARGKHRRVEHGLDQKVAHRVRMQVTSDCRELEAVARRQRQHDRVLRRRGLQLEVELGAKTFAKSESPCPVDPAAVRRMNDELHAARFVEKPLEHDPLVRRQCP